MSSALPPPRRCGTADSRHKHSIALLARAGASMHLSPDHDPARPRAHGHAPVDPHAESDRDALARYEARLAAYEPPPSRGRSRRSSPSSSAVGERPPAPVEAAASSRSAAERGRESAQRVVQDVEHEILDFAPARRRPEQSTRAPERMAPPQHRAPARSRPPQAAQAPVPARPATAGPAPR